MQSKTNSLAALTAMFAAAAMLTACGGGGGGGTDTGTPSPPPAPSPAPSTSIVTQVPPATYAAGSNELLAFNRLNAERARCGFGLLAQNAKLDQAAQNHRAYLVANQVSGHNETAGQTGFTGATPQDRAMAAGYNGNVGEAVTTGIFSAPQTFGDGDRQVLGLISLPYHAFLVTDGTLEIGLSWGGSAFVAVPAFPAGKPAQTAPGVRTYPCDGSTNVRHIAVTEVPNPFPTEPGATWGPAISVFGESVRVTTATVTGPNGSVAIKAVYGDGQTVDPNGICKGNRACVIPVALAENTSYQVNIAGTQAGTPFTKAFTFTTMKLN